MKKIVREDYYLGLDIGTESVGYAVTNESYKILKFNGKSMWGSRLFDKAKTAEETRIFRCNSRRGNRRKWRLELLQQLFSQEIAKIDTGFYQRLKESALFREDKISGEKYSLFNDSEYTDIDFYNEFKSIYHLRKELVKGEKEYDIRLVYLAIHHILKNRGHFLFSGDIENVTSFSTAYETFKECLLEEFDIELICNSQTDLEATLKNKVMTKNDKNKKLIGLLNCAKSHKQLKAIIGLISGSKVKLSDVFNDEDLKEIDSISFTEANYDKIREELEDVIQERCNILDIIKGVYDWAILADILKCDENEKSMFLSYAKVRVYKEHKEDLELLKRVIKAYDKEKYIEFFKRNCKNNYCSYIGFLEKNRVKKSIKKCTQDEFYGNVKKIMKEIKEKNGVYLEINLIEEKVNSGTFMPLQITKSNGVIPYQVNYMELKKILENVSRYLVFLNNKDSENSTVTEKILSLLEFRIPYYVGPLNTSDKKNSWMVRKEDGRITPWNFEEKVDIDESAKLFIRRMTNKCTYLVRKDVLPKNSLYYSEFEVWNEINNIKLKGKLLPIELKESLFENIFKNNKKVTLKMIIDFLKSEGYKFDKEELTGLDKEIKSSLRAYKELSDIFKRKIVAYEDMLMAEKLILLVTLYSADTKMLKRVIRKHYDENKLDELQLKKIIKLKYDGWAAFSKELLLDVEGTDIETGECYSILQALRHTNKNFMELLSQKYTFIEEIQKYNSFKHEDIEEISYDAIVKDLYVSPKIKRAIWQVIQITEEIKKVMGKEPKKIFIEVAKEHQESDRTKSRKTHLMELYAKCKDEECDWKNELENREESDFRSIKLYLYYTQKGRCLYTNKEIALSELANTNIYDRDHIYPKSLTKDNSLDNLVLVDKTANSEKGNGNISIEIQNRMKVIWKELRKKGFISEEKYNRLIRTTPLTDEELAGFINRQLVETRQSTKVVANMFKSLYQKSEIVYVKANSVSDFRHKNLKAVKVRTLNDLHHAKDAYLNIVVGNVYHEKFTNNPMMWLKDNRDKNNYSLNQMFNFDLCKRDKVIWKRGKDGTISTVKGQIKKNDILCTRYAVTNKGAFFNLQIVGATENATVPVKKGMNIDKYGGYKSLTPAYFSLVEYLGENGDKIRTIESVPLYLVKEFEADIKKYENYCKDIYGLKEPRVIIKKIKKDTLMVVNGFPMNLRGSTGKQLSMQVAVQLCLKEEQEIYFKKIEKYIKRNNERTDKKIILKITDKENISKDQNLKLYDILLAKQKDTIYKYRPANQISKLEKGREIFENISLEYQCIVLNEIISLMRCKPITANLSLINGAKEAGRIGINKVISELESVKIINQSVTGLFRVAQIDLMKI